MIIIIIDAILYLLTFHLSLVTSRDIALYKINGRIYNEHFHVSYMILLFLAVLIVVRINKESSFILVTKIIVLTVMVMINILIQKFAWKFFYKRYMKNKQIK